MRRRVLPGVLAAGLCVWASGGTASAASCDVLGALELPDTTVTSASAHGAGPLVLPGAVAPVTLPLFCRVTGRTTPAIAFEVWLPAEGWNGKLQAVGNSRVEGAFNYGAMIGALHRGYAVTGTDLGHVSKPGEGFDASWAAGRPDLVVDFGHRAVHLTTVNAKEIVRAFYGRAPERAYFVGCSKGGQQGLMEAQRYPEDFDGILAGAPAHDWTRFYAGGHLWYATATLKDPESYIPPAKLPLFDAAVDAACDALDGVTDGLLSDPRACRFDPQVLACKAGQGASSCYTPKQVKALAQILAGAHTSGGDLIFPGLMPGAASAPNGWGVWVTGPVPFTSTHWLAADSFFKHVVFDDAAWNLRDFDFDRDVNRALTRVGGVLDAIDPNLEPFRARGGKLIVYHGWTDADISPLSSIAYFDEVVSTIGGQDRHEALRTTQAFFRLFMAPGMGHCGGGPGPNSFDAMSALEAWVERGVAPDTIPAVHVTDGVVDRSRPLCPYPAVARWTGTGSTDHAETFSCTASAPPDAR